MDKFKDKSLAETIDRYRKVLLNLVEDMETDGLSSTTITTIIKQGSKGYV